MLLIILLYAVRSQWPSIQINMECISKYFNDCSFRGSNNEYLLFECKEYSVLLPKTALNQTNEKPFFIGINQNHHLHDELYLYLGDNIVTLQILNGTKLLHFIKYSKNYCYTRIDSQLSVISYMKTNSSSHMFNISLLFVEPIQEKLYKKYVYQLQCSSQYDQWEEFRIKQYYNQTTKSLAIFFGSSEFLYFIQFSLIHRNFSLQQELYLKPYSYYLTESGLMYLFMEKQITIYQISQKLEQYTIFDLSSFGKYKFLINLQGQHTQYMLQQIDSNSLRLIEIKKVYNKFIMEIKETLNITFSSEAFKVSDHQLVFLDQGFMRTLLDLSTGQIQRKNYQESVCEEVNLFTELLKQKDFKEIGVSYNEICKKGQIFKWIYHPGSPKYQRIEISGKFDWTKVVKQEIYWNENGLQIIKPWFLYPNFSFYYQLIFLSDTEINELILLISEYKDEDDEQVDSIMAIYFLLSVVIIVFLHICMKKIMIRREKKEIEQKYIQQYSFSPSIVVYEETECSICFGTFQINQKVCQPLCGHTFHYKCFKQWLEVCQKLIKCPACNQNLDNLEIKKRDPNQSQM